MKLTRKLLLDWAGPQVLRDADVLLEKGLVMEAELNPPLLSGAILWNSRPLKTALKILSETVVESQCPCRMNVDRGLICPHVIALGLHVIRRQTDPLREAKYREEQRRASRMAVFKDDAYIRRSAAPDSLGIPASLALRLPEDWLALFAAGRPVLEVFLEYDNQLNLLESVPRDLEFHVSKPDEAILFVLEDICEGPATSRIEMKPADFLNVLKLGRGRELPQSGGAPLRIAADPLPVELRATVDETQTGLQLALQAGATAPRAYLVAGNEAWALAEDALRPMACVLPLPYHGLYAGPILVPRVDLVRFMRHELPLIEKILPVQSEITMDMLTLDPATPRFRLAIRGSPASLSATLYAEYPGPHVLVAGKPDPAERFGVPDPDDFLRFLVRNPPAECTALAALEPYGFRGETGDTLTSVVDNRNVLRFLGSAVPLLRRAGWEIGLEGKVEGYFESLDFVTPVVRIHDTPGTDWFDVEYLYEDTQGTSVSAVEVQRALRMGESFIQRGDRVLLLDTDAVESMLDVFRDCRSADGGDGGAFRLSSIYAPFVKSSLDALDGIDVEARPDWRAQADLNNRSLVLEALDPMPLDNILRPYQKQGVNWLHFLERHGFCGVLGDDMGLGKTLQTLAWRLAPRPRETGPAKPALIVCPTSLVENWFQEAGKFTPDLRVLTMTGSERHDRWNLVPEHALVVTSYAILRRDLEKFLEFDFSAVILDEAQHIKNRSTQNALAAKRLRAAHRLVLTGTPMENSVADLWSIMDFLMPGYLGGHEAFRARYEQPIAHGGPEAEFAQRRLRRKLHPFLLRRRKSEVARDLPPKIEQVSMCPLSPDQQVVYAELLRTSRQRMQELVKAQGFGRARMEILALLTRLRQACCHLDLLELPGLKPEHPSAKMDLFFELLDEAMDSGHRVLVFSQFVRMLTILRRELETRSIRYSYLDGATKERMKVVHEFNGNRDIPLFLISLKAGGTGLNLTGADMVMHYDPWWNPAVENQATDRAYRIGQSRTVFSYKLITTGTIEEKVLALQARKKAVIDATVESDDPMLTQLTQDDIEGLLA